ncbi:MULTISPECIES: hypothetical protein [unclassified Knoellia]|uniref:hypothetical protein n=1 Tax=Knoellia altitudinis TaxID=3404795 RepID=UPI003605AD71
MTRRSRRSSSAPRRVGSDAGLTSARPLVDQPSEPGRRAREEDASVSGRHTAKKVDQTKDDTDEGWGEAGDGDASARWLRENRPPHWD